MMIFFIHQNFSKNWKNWSFRPPRTWGPFWLNSHVQMSEFIYFTCPGVKIWWFFFSFSKTYRRIEKIEVFANPALGTFLTQFTLVHIFIQMSEFLYFSCPGVKIWWFSSFSKTSKNFKEWTFRPPRTSGPFRLNSHVQMNEFLYFSCPGVKNMMIFFIFKDFSKNRKNWSYCQPRPGDLFYSVHTCAHFPSKWSNFYILIVLGVKIWWFSSFSKTFQKIKKIEVFANSGPGDLFGSIHTYAYFPSK